MFSFKFCSVIVILTLAVSKTLFNKESSELDYPSVNRLFKNSKIRHVIIAGSAVEFLKFEPWVGDRVEWGGEGRRQPITLMTKTNSVLREKIYYTYFQLFVIKVSDIFYIMFY